MMPRTAIAQIAKIIGRELDTGAGPSEEALAAGPTLAEAGAATEIVGSLLAEARRKRPHDRMIAGYSFMLEGALGTLRLQSSGGDIGADRAIAEVRHRLDDALKKGGIAPEVLMLMARAFARADLDPGRTPSPVGFVVTKGWNNLSPDLRRYRCHCRAPALRPRRRRSRVATLRAGRSSGPAPSRWRLAVAQHGGTIGTGLGSLDQL